MAGNVLEWCWDWNGDLLGGANPRGPATGADRVMRGGSWINDSIALRCGYRIADYTWYRTYGTDAKGFRCVKGL